MNETAKTVLNLLYPRKCVNCCSILGITEDFLCKYCINTLPYIGEHFCLKCGKYLEDMERELCEDCQNKKHFFLQNRGIFQYEKNMKQMIYRFKYQNQRYYGEFFGKEVVHILGSQIKKWQVDGMVPVPLHRSRQRIRGFNQAEEIVREVSIQLGLPVYNHLIIRGKRTLPQKLLSQKEREKNLKSAFKMVDNGVKLNGVLLVDDIYTTGCTIDSLAETFLEAGVKRIYSLCLCIGKGR